MPDGETESSMTLWVGCSHGRLEAHADWVPYQSANDIKVCPGGREASIEDVHLALDILTSDTMPDGGNA